MYKKQLTVILFGLSLTGIAFAFSNHNSPSANPTFSNSAIASDQSSMISSTRP